MHFLAFDVFVGRWVFLDSQARGVPAWLASPTMALTFLFGPLGFLAYLTARAAGRPGLPAEHGGAPGER